MELSATTFVFEIVNFLVLAWILQRLLYRPLRRGIDERRAALEGREREAQEKVQAAATLESELDARAKEIEELRARTMRDATEQAAEERARLLAEARDDAAGERSRASHLVAAEREEARAWVGEVAVEHASVLAGRLVMELAPDAVDDALAQMLLHEIARQKDALTAAFAASGRRVEVRVARRLGDDTMDRFRDALRDALGEAPQLRVDDDTSLLAGVQLRVGSMVLDASLSGELIAFRDRARELLRAAQPEASGA